ncbi:MAG: GIY-YIG nuclease family protein [Candidatus Stahlbacteria bacterium]|nr:MAG: GIY-YIG nuclease family protein [Candidatus Stahlbacteria bacterium]
MKGIYALILLLTPERYIVVGKLGKLLFRAGYYVYVGSAFSGIERLNRHVINFRRGNVDKPHWHIDYIAPYSKLMEYIFIPCPSRNKEGELANVIAKYLSYTPGFGSSDTNAPSHLFFSISLKEIKENLEKSFNMLDLNPIQVKDFKDK